MSVRQVEGYSIFLEQELGKGSFGSVYRGRQDATGDEVAIKILSKDSIDRDEYLKAALKNEIQILQKLHSDNIVAFYDVQESSKNYYLIQQLCDGDLATEIKRGGERSEAEAVEMMKQICNGFLTLVREGIMHRDLKPANILLKGKTLKLGDFGFARQVGARATVNASVGTPLYMPLEVLRGQEYSSKCDVWALGFIFYELLHGDTPWRAVSAAQLVRNIEKQPLEMGRTDLSPTCEDFLRRCLQLREANRISWDQIFVHELWGGCFLGRGSGEVYEDKMKMVMNKLRFYIKKHNLDLGKVMDSLGFGFGKQEVSYQDFYHFFRRVYPEITNEETDYVFRKTDTDHSGSISVEELKAILLASGIKLEAQFEVVPSFQRRGDGGESFTRISVETSTKIKNCFQKLYRIINKNGLTLYRVFHDFDNRTGSLTLQQFTLLVAKITGSPTDIAPEEVRAGFDLIDQDGSNSIEFDELDKYYSKINGVPRSALRRPTSTKTLPQGTFQFKPRGEVRRRTRPEQPNIQPLVFIQQYNRPPPYYEPQSERKIEAPQELNHRSSSPKFDPFAVLRRRL